MFYLFFISLHSPKHVLQHTFQPFRGPFLYVLTYLLHWEDASFVLSSQFWYFGVFLSSFDNTDADRVARQADFHTARQFFRPGVPLEWAYGR